MNLRACLDRGFGKSSRVGKGLNRPISSIQPAAGIDLSSSELGRLRAIQHLDRSSAFGPHQCVALQGPNAPNRPIRLDPALPDGITVNAIALDQLEHEIRRFSDEGQHPLAHLIAKGRNQVVRCSVESRNDLSACLTGGAPPRRFGLKDRYA